jgi:hypothetical protein
MFWLVLYGLIFGGDIQWNFTKRFLLRITQPITLRIYLIAALREAVG